MCEVSVIIPVYNIKKEMLNRCVDSVINQNLNDIEILIIDDGSEDKCAKLCDSYKEIDRRIQIVHQTNQGVSVARNEGIKRAVGRWIAFVDGDDWIEPKMLSILNSYGNKNKADIVLCDCFLNYGRKQIKTSFFQEQELNLENSNKQRFILQFLCSRIYNDGINAADSGAPWAKLYRRSFLLEKNLLFDKNLRRMQDNIFNLYAYEYANSIQYIHLPLYHYRKNIDSGSYRYNSEISNIYNLVFDEILRYILYFNKDNLFRDALNYKIFFSIYVILNIDIFNKDNKSRFIDKKKKLFSIIDSYYYKKAINEMNKGYLKFIEKIFYFFVKYRLFCAMYIALTMKKIFYEIIGRNVDG